MRRHWKVIAHCADSEAVVKVRGAGGAQPHLLSVGPPLLKFQPWLPKTWPGLHCMRAVVLFVFCYQNIEYITTLFVCFLCVSCVYLAGTTLLTTNSLSIICVLICAPCFYHVATMIRHFMTHSWCICLIHFCKVVFLNLGPPPCCQQSL